MFAQPPPPPRPTSLATTDWNAQFMMLFGGLWAGTCLLMAVLFTLPDRPFWDDWALDQRGVRVEAEAVDVQSTHSSVNDEDVFDIVLRFKDRHGKSHTATLGTTNAARIQSARAHGKFTIEYDPRDPSCARFMGEHVAMMGGASLILCITAAPAIPLFLVGLVRGLRTRRLYRRGIAAEARVTEVVATASEENEKPVMEMRYVLETPTGSARGSWKTVEPAEVGATIWVVYDPRNPDRNTPSIS